MSTSFGDSYDLESPGKSKCVSRDRSVQGNYLNCLTVSFRSSFVSSYPKVNVGNLLNSGLTFI